MLLSLRVQIEFLSIFSFFWPPRKTKQGTEALRGWFHRLTQVEDHFREGFLKMAAFFFSFFLWLSMRIFFFQFFFFWMMMMTQGKRKRISLDTMIFFFRVSSSCMSFPDTLLCVRPDPLRALKSHLCLGLPAWWSLMGSPVWSKRYLARTTVGAHSLTSRCWHGGIKWENSSPMDASTTCGQGSPGEHFLGIVENVQWISSGIFKWETLQRC